MFLPVCLNITDKPVVLIGGGRTAYHKATVLCRFTQKATVISPVFHEGFEQLPFRLVRKSYERSDLEGAFLVYICTEQPELNVAIKADCAALGILANVCDHPSLCDFVSPAIYKEGNVAIAVSSNATDVRQSIALRNRIRALVEQGLLLIRSSSR
jgi:siroheme synthase-like protein